MSEGVNLNALTGMVRTESTLYQNAIRDMEQAVQAGANGISITDMSVNVTNVGVHQSISEMASGMAKNVAEHVKGLGRKIGG